MPGAEDSKRRGSQKLKYNIGAIIQRTPNGGFSELLTKPGKFLQLL